MTEEVILDVYDGLVPHHPVEDRQEFIDQGISEDQRPAHTEKPVKRRPVGIIALLQQGEEEIDPHQHAEIPQMVVPVHLKCPEPLPGLHPGVILPPQGLQHQQQEQDPEHHGQQHPAGPADMLAEIRRAAQQQIAIHGEKQGHAHGHQSPSIHPREFQRGGAQPQIHRIQRAVKHQHQTQCQSLQPVDISQPPGPHTLLILHSVH